MDQQVTINLWSTAAQIFCKEKFTSLKILISWLKLGFLFCQHDRVQHQAAISTQQSRS
jgi:hypothetical protein